MNIDPIRIGVLALTAEALDAIANQVESFAGFTVLRYKDYDKLHTSEVVLKYLIIHWIYQRDQTQVMREQLRYILRNHPGIQIVGYTGVRSPMMVEVMQTFLKENLLVADLETPAGLHKFLEEIKRP